MRRGNDEDKRRELSLVPVLERAFGLRLLPYPGGLMAPLDVMAVDANGRRVFVAEIKCYLGSWRDHARLHLKTTKARWLLDEQRGHELGLYRAVFVIGWEDRAVRAIDVRHVRLDIAEPFGKTPPGRAELDNDRELGHPFNVCDMAWIRRPV